jgi:hypothetical protein
LYLLRIRLFVPTRNLWHLPASNAINHTWICNAFENATEEPNNVDMLHVLDVCGKKSENTPDNLKGRNQNVWSAGTKTSARFDDGVNDTNSTGLWSI